MSNMENKRRISNAGLSYLQSIHLTTIGFFSFIFLPINFLLLLVR